jgi:serralysin
LTAKSDTYITKDGDEAVYGLAGNDKITIHGLFYDEEYGETSIMVYGGPGNDQILSVTTVSGQIVYGGSGNDRIEIRGGDSASGKAMGAGGNDTLICVDGDKGCYLVGGTGDDKLSSKHASAAWLEGGPGKDMLTSGQESWEYFLFRKGDTVAGQRQDTISGFQSDFDNIDLSPIDANTGQPGDQAFTLVATTKHPAVGQVSYYKSGTSTIVVANDGTTTFEIELLSFGQELLGADFTF